MKKILTLVIFLSLIISTTGCISSISKEDSTEETRYLSSVEDYETGLYGYIDETGKYVIEPQFMAVGPLPRTAWLQSRIKISNMAISTKQGHM